MVLQAKSKQRGISLIGLIVVGSLLAATGVIIAQVVPTVIELQAIQKAATKAAAEGGTVLDVRASFDRAATIDDIKSIQGKDLVVTKDGERVVVSYAYQREIHLTGPAWLTLKYQGQTK